ncbi:hypothetical protein ASPWEDRAFT_49741 [Aspergillus wentii DTO 134E9]|uniref:Glutaminase n=1 Tax=Aspergillus wentii DTO 134E9 TaxID=1073089 RepID=A0A1L9RY81_ASPWE|nr:uncharacterized protein ASPWEDRAFT_49741 [Aspergillus wentii DTO 134E9]OJJ39889.1 hypothetical protein ASPWEDRAFT_49741 [Aspergillus wentii DTO 134E9]
MGFFSNLRSAFGLILGSTLLHTSIAATFTPFAAPSYPLAVRNPYLSVWLPGDSASDLPSSSPKFWSGGDLTWSVIARVDGQAYNLFGVSSSLDNSKAATVTGASFTSTHSTFTLEAGSRTFTLDFLSPVSPKNLLRQSLPFAYLTISVSGASDGSSVQIYSDIDSSWTGQPDNSKWHITTNDTTSIYHLGPVNGATFSQTDPGQALWGETAYATRPSNQSNLTSASGPLSSIRSQFVSNGALSNSHAEWTSDGVAGFAHDLGKVTDKTSVTFAIGHVRERVIDYVGNAQAGYYWAKYPGTVQVASHFLDDYAGAASESTALDNLIQTGGEDAYGSNYSGILALSLRQVFGGIEVTIPHDSLDTSNPSAFIKEISSNGNINTVDVIYATFPIFYILSPEFIKLLIKPVLEYVTSDAYSEEYAVHDLGTHYPNATGHDPNGEAMPIEESGNIILLTYAYEKGLGQSDISSNYGSLLQQYAQYLQNNGLYPASQLSLNDALGEVANQTNLAVKAASALGAYGDLTSQTNYTNLGKEFADKIWTDRLGTDADGTYFTFQYGNDTWFETFNHYPDVLFNLDIFPQEVYNATSAFYPTVRQAGGVALKQDLNWGQTNWQSFVGATVTGEARDQYVADLHAYISNGLNPAPFSDRYWVADNGEYKAGEYYVFRARPTLGSHFALWALKGANQWSD